MFSSLNSFNTSDIQTAKGLFAIALRKDLLSGDLLTTRMASWKFIPFLVSSNTLSPIGILITLLYKWLSFQYDAQRCIYAMLGISGAAIFNAIFNSIVKKYPPSSLAEGDIYTSAAL